MGPLESSDAAAARFGAESTSGLSGAPLPSEERGIGVARPLRHGARRESGRAIGRAAGQPRGELVEDRVYAALDLGTNNCRLLIARAGSGRRRADFASSIPFPASFGSARACRAPAGSARRRSSAPSKRSPFCRDKMRCARRDARPPHRHRSLPRRRKMAPNSSTGRTLRPASTLRSSTARPKRSSPPPARPRLPTPRPKRRFIRYRRRLVGNRLARPRGARQALIRAPQPRPRRRAARAHPLLGVAEARRRHPGGEIRRP